jgi:uncharacterized membrane protein YhaH (DUF805 family)
VERYQKKKVELHPDHAFIEITPSLLLRACFPEFNLLINPRVNKLQLALSSQEVREIFDQQDYSLSEYPEGALIRREYVNRCVNLDLKRGLDRICKELEKHGYRFNLYIGIRRHKNLPAGAKEIFLILLKMDPLGAEEKAKIDRIIRSAFVLFENHMPVETGILSNIDTELSEKYLINSQDIGDVRPNKLDTFGIPGLSSHIVPFEYRDARELWKYGESIAVDLERSKSFLYHGGYATRGGFLYRVLFRLAVSAFLFLVAAETTTAPNMVDFYGALFGLPAVYFLLGAGVMSAKRMRDIRWPKPGLPFFFNTLGTTTYWMFLPFSFVFLVFLPGFREKWLPKIKYKTKSGWQ